MPMNPSMPETTELFVANWTTYQRVVANNYMYHRELYAEAEKPLAELELSPFRLLDLGCGDASPLAPVLRALPLSGYTGVDLSDAALQQAARHLAALPCPILLRQGDILEFLQTTTERYEVIFSSFALHHLDSKDKQALLTACRERLMPAGCMILIDIARGEDQDTTDYLDAYCQTVATHWTGLDAQEKANIIDHVRGNDLPERVSDLAAMAKQAGFSRFETVASYTAHHLFSLGD